jgi:hypothetical protein
LRFLPWRCVFVLVVTFLVVGGKPGLASAALSPEWVEKWEEDLVFAHEVLREKHPSPFEQLTPEEMQAEFDELISRLPELDHHGVIVDLARIVARVEDGHTRLTLPLGPGVDFMQGHSETESPTLAEMNFHQYPLRLGIDEKGVWIQGVSRDHQRFLGGRLVSIDGRSAEEAVERVSPTIQRDNEMQVLHHLPMHLVLSELLHARGVADSAERATFVIEKRDGTVESIDLLKAPGNVPIDWVMAGPPTGTTAPLAKQRNEANFWFTDAASSKLVYVQFNTVYDTDEETIRQFSERLSTHLEENPESALVIDLRGNRGGNQSLALPLLHAVIGSPQNLAGQLFTIIGRTTFSAAMTFSLLMEKHTQTLFVGEPTGSKPNHYGDSRKSLLPNSNVTLRISSLYWQWNPRDSRDWIEPHAEAPPSLEAELAGSDPVLERVEELIASDATEASGEWRGNLPPANYGRDSVLRFETAAETLAATVDIPAFGLSGTALENLVLESGKISFQITVGEETISYQGRINETWMVGEGELGSVRFPFLMERTKQQP